MSSMSYSQNFSPANPPRELVFDVSHTADGAFAVDLRQSIISWNAAAEELLGYGQEQVLGHKCGSILGICGKQKANCDSGRCHALANTVRGRLTPHTEVAVKTRGGELRRLSMSVIAARSSTGEMCMVHLFHDVTLPGRSPAEVIERPEAAGSAPSVSFEPGQRSYAGEQATPQLTHREHEVLRLLAAGLTTGDIAANLSISPITVRNHVTKIIEKLDVKTRLQAVVVASRLGLI